MVDNVASCLTTFCASPIRRPPSACEHDSDNTNWGQKAAEGARRPSDTGPGFRRSFTRNDDSSSFNIHPQGAGGCPTLSLLFEEASHETLIFELLTPTPNGQRGPEGRRRQGGTELVRTELIRKSSSENSSATKAHPKIIRSKSSSEPTHPKPQP